MTSKRNKWRPLWVAVAVTAVLGIALTIEPVRVVAEDFLSIFRVQEISFMQFDSDQVEKLEEISAVLEENFLQVEPVLEQQPEVATGRVVGGGRGGRRIPRSDAIRAPYCLQWEAYD